MALLIQNETVVTPIVDLSGAYVRLLVEVEIEGQVNIGLYAYQNEAKYVDEGNPVLLGRFSIENVTAANQNLTNYHAKAKEYLVQAHGYAEENITNVNI